MTPGIHPLFGTMGFYPSCFLPSPLCFLSLILLTPNKYPLFFSPSPLPLFPMTPPHTRLLDSPNHFPPLPAMAPASPTWLICSALYPCFFAWCPPEMPALTLSRDSGALCSAPYSKFCYQRRFVPGLRRWRIFAPGVVQSPDKRTALVY